MTTNTIAFTSGAVVKPLLARFNSKTLLLNWINKQYSDQFARSGAKVGDTVYVIQSAVPTVGSGSTATSQDFIETKVPVVLSSQKHAQFDFTSYEETLEMDDEFERRTAPALEALASEVEEDGIALICANTANCAIAAAPTAPVMKDILGVGAKISKFDGPVSDRYLLIDPLDEYGLVASVASQFNPADAMSATYRSGSIGEAYGQVWGRSSRLPTITIGGDVQGAVDAYVSGATTMTVTGFGNAQVIQAGTVFSVVARYAVQPQTKATLGFAKQIVVTEDVTMDVGGAGTLKIQALYATGAQKNISALPVNGDVINLVGTAGKTYRQVLIFNKDCATFATADLKKIPSIDSASETMNGIRARYNMGGSVKTDEAIYRLDTLYGWSMLKGDWAAKLLVEV